MYRYCSKYSKMKCVSLFMCLTVNNCYKSLQHIVYEAAVSLTVLVQLYVWQCKQMSLSSPQIVTMRRYILPAACKIYFFCTSLKLLRSQLFTAVVMVKDQNYIYLGIPMRSENSKVLRINNDSNLFRENIGIIDFDSYLPFKR